MITDPKVRQNLFWQWCKDYLCLRHLLCGAAFAIMTFNNDVSVTSVFGEVYRLLTGQESSGHTILELSHSVGLAVGIIVFFNHFAKWKINTDPHTGRRWRCGFMRITSARL